mmetsp:Transcript_14282/g.28473  ORF Transcript_14282/g.28473 Transcript_14282/m.28473 type:complete len:218 (-) Transcript_14282:306-959(-)|eukprot:CAMPEP_0181324922 /NCGR_PEP_ID=MMETSP1101-20121128/20635_1 /TAXON_ID=46948 /ORGANISM="Rhodomonas abbreviata, Strain Caron Lab Isolate" /LENGTH=217 /DNA_ID=CAMNT_0023433165 /DNA_START=134 /DNA_END=787 /DNA_ORIENTATION=-
MGDNVYLFVPNIIGYVRIITGILAFLYAHDWRLFFGFYFISYFLDCLDGLAARKLNQATRFGQMLDMVTDRCCSACLLALLASLYPGLMGFGFYMLLALDLGSHYCMVYSQLLSGTENHKKVSDQATWLLKTYYTNQAVLFFLCLFNESFFVMAYLLFHANGSPDAEFVKPPAMAVLLVCLPFMALKQLINLLQLLMACGNIVDFDVKQRALAAAKK